MTNDITILSCPQCGFPLIRDCGNGLYQCDDCGTHFDKNENIVQTNEEWLHTLNTEEKAKWLSQRSQILYDCGQRDVFPKIMYEEDWEWWLKQPHTKE